jgi:hypothetical protein
METIDLKPGEQQNQAHKYDLILTAIGLSFILILLVMGNQALGLILSAGLVVLPTVFRGIWCFLKKFRLIAEKLPHFKIDETLIVDKKAGFWAKTETTCWNDVKKLEVKLFEVELMTHSGQAKKIDLNLLPDEDLKYVKKYLLAIKKTKGI